MKFLLDTNICIYALKQHPRHRGRIALPRARPRVRPAAAAAAAATTT
jgi:predicted nucleic acid-binding protein